MHKQKYITICRQRDLNLVIDNFLRFFHPMDIVLIRFSSVERVTIHFAIPDENIFDAIFVADDFDIFREGTGSMLKKWEEWGVPLPNIPDISLFEKLNKFIEDMKDKPVWIVHCDEAESRSPAIALGLAIKFGLKDIAEKILSNFFTTINWTFVFMFLKDEIIKFLIQSSSSSI